MSIHISSKKDEVAKIVLMAGDPLRVKHFVENYLTDYKLINTIRGELGYTGYLDKTRVSVFSHGMGLDSIAIYAYELFNEYDVEHIIRFGSAGSYSKDIHIFDILIAEKAYTESNFGIAYDNNTNYASPSDKLLKIALEEAKKMDLKSNKIIPTTIHSSTWFYTKPNFIDPNKMVEKGINAVEMEAYALYTVATYLKKSALTILTISDSLVTKEIVSPKDRETKFELMFKYLVKIVNQI